MRFHLLAGASALGLLFGSCSSAPVVPMPPTVHVADFSSVLITPDAMRFVGKVVIENQMRGPLDLQKVDYGADLHDQPLFDKQFDKLDRMRSRGRTTVTLPFTVPMSEIARQGEDVLAEHGVRVRLRGQVVPVGFDSIAFEATKVVPLPRLPEVSFAGARGTPLQGEFTVFLDVRNQNPFPVSCGKVDTWLTINGRRYAMVQGQSFSSLRTGQTGRVALTMKTSKRKGISMLVNVVKNRSSDYSVGGVIACRTPHGRIELPVEFRSGGDAAAPGR